MTRKYSWIRWLALGVLIFVGVAFEATQAATIDVNTFNDETTTGDGFCSLREAVAAINNGADTADCVNTLPSEAPYGTNDTIVLPAGIYDLTVPEPSATGSVYGEYTVTKSADGSSYTVSVNPDNSVGDLDIAKSVTIEGAEPGATIQAGTGFNDRILHIFAASGTVDVTLSGVTIKGGTSPLNGTDIGTDSSGNAWALRILGGGVATGVGATAYDTTKTGLDTSGSGSGGSSGEGETGATYILTIKNSSILDNQAGDGGGIYSTATLSIANSTISGNTATANGGGLYNDAAMTLFDTTLDSNQAEGGGGLFDTGSHDSLIVGSTLSRNQAVGGGGISSRSLVTLTVADSTISGNQAQDTGGGIYTNGTVKLYFVTVADNSVTGETSETDTTGDTTAEASTGGGGAGVNTFGSGSILLSNTLLANNLVGTTLANCGASGGASEIDLVDDGYNLDSGDSCHLSAGGDLTGVDPRIGPLGNNGGPTETHALQSGSPAIDAGRSPGVTLSVMDTSFDPARVDQRNLPRSSVPDIGAYEGGSLSSNDGSGGCTMGSSNVFDPTLVLLALVAFCGLAWKWVRRSR